MNKWLKAISCALIVCGAFNAHTAPLPYKQKVKKVQQTIAALNRKLDTIIKQRDQLTAYLKQIRQQYRGEK